MPQSPDAATLERGVALLVAGGQLVVWARAPTPSLAEHARQAVLVACALLPPLMGAAYRRHRLWLIPLVRTGVFLMPSQRSAQVRSRAQMHAQGSRQPGPPSVATLEQEGAAGIMISRPPTPGMRGLAVDVVRLLVGLRLASAVLITLLIRVPLPIAACAHACVVLLTRNNEAYCASQVRRALQRRCLFAATWC